jgi:hypothetical protein
VAVGLEGGEDGRCVIMAKERTFDIRAQGPDDDDL